MADQAAADFEPALDRLIEPALSGLADGLAAESGLGVYEQRAVLDGAREALTAALLRKVNRLLLLELNAARVTGRLTAADSAGRWAEWLAGTRRPGFWASLDGDYPALARRLRAVIDNRCAAALALARAFAADRAVLAGLPGVGPGDLVEVEFGAGDSHHGGRTVALLRTASGRVVFKPRSVAVDQRLGDLLEVVLAGRSQADRIRVPEVVACDGYGWAEHVGHRYCADDAELSAFYRNIGHWLAVMRLVGGSDLHAENVIAAGPVPVVVDCETLFTPHAKAVPSGRGLANDRAAERVADSVLRTGLLPGRGQALGWRGVDSSAVGALPGQQPAISMPVIIGAGTDEARLGYQMVPAPAAGNHPSPDPVLSRYWSRVVAGFTELTEHLRELDRRGSLAEPLNAFADCPIRVVVRNTETYMELGRMLWHPASLHAESPAVAQAADLMAKHAANACAAPGDAAVIQAEIAELLDGDVPVFGTTPREGRLTGPRGTAFGPVRNLVQAALDRWRTADLELDRQVIQGTLVSAYLNEGWLPDAKPMIASRVTVDRLDQRRRQAAAKLMHGVRDSAIRAEDGSVTWIAPVLNQTGWSLQPLSNDIYAGISGVAVLIAAYLFETEHDRADAVSGLDSLLDDVLRTLRAIEDQDHRQRAQASMALRPDAPGGYVGLGSRIWAWLLLRRLGITESEDGEVLRRAAALAAQLPAAIADDGNFDLFRGMAGAVVPLLRLAEHSGHTQGSDLALAVGDRLTAAAIVDDRGARWGNQQFPDGIGGTAHGATGVGWALARLAAAGAPTGDLAEAAFAFEETLYSAKLAGWIDLRDGEHTAAAWCHGAGGIGVTAADLMTPDDLRSRDILRRAAAATWADGLGWNHTLCHGDFGVWEVMDRALTAGVAPQGVDRAALDAQVLSGLEEFGAVSGLARDAFAPGLLSGVGGVAYQLLRMHPECPLPSVLVPDPGEASPL
ncbi:MAG: type 2 lantipeptide synthetase LanM [Catenulispora sp.]|nr:type 2 lantipeptide synthetase LanM [Catenulispora sp.]